MFDNMLNYLEQLDLSEIEAKLFLKLLETGPISVKDLAQQIGIKRTTAYIYIDQLVNRGLVTKVVTGTKKMIAATDIENLENLIDEKIAMTNSLKQIFPDISREIKSKFISSEAITNYEIKYYKGLHNAQKIYLEALESKEMRSYVKIKETETFFPDNVHVFENAFKDNKKLKVWEMIYGADSTVKDAERVSAVSDRYFYKYMPGHLKLSSEDILIYDGKVAIINYRGGKTSVVLQSFDFYNNFKALFDFMWSIIK